MFLLNFDQVFDSMLLTCFSLTVTNSKAIAVLLFHSLKRRDRVPVELLDPLLSSIFSFTANNIDNMSTFLGVHIFNPMTQACLCNLPSPQPATTGLPRIRSPLPPTGTARPVILFSPPPVPLGLWLFHLHRKSAQLLQCLSRAVWNGGNANSLQVDPGISVSGCTQHICSMHRCTWPGPP